MDFTSYLKQWRGRPHLQKMSQPAGWWRDAFPLGNGEMGAMPYGRICEERILINHERLWYNGKIPDLPEHGHLLSKCRELIAAGEYVAADELYEKAWEEMGIEGDCATYHPAADLRLNTISQVRFRNYQRYLDLNAAESLTVWEWAEQAQLRRSFVSRADDVLVVSMSGESFREQVWDLDFEMHELLDAIDKDGMPFDPPIDFKATAEPGWLVGVGQYTDPLYEGAEYGLVARVISNGRAAVQDRLDGKCLRVSGADEILIIVKLFTYETSDDAVARLKDELLGLEADYEVLRKRHVAIHEPLYLSCQVEFAHPTELQVDNESLLKESYKGRIPLALLQKLTDYGRYLLLCSSGKGVVPSNLQGIWNGDYAPPWDCFLMANENLEMNYWQALPAGMNRAVLDVFDFYASRMDDFRENARKQFGCRGIFIPALTSPETGLSTHCGSWIINWISAAGWLSQLFYDYWLFTGDEAFLEQRLLPYMKEVAEFYEDYFTIDSEGQVVISPSTSPENWPREFCPLQTSKGRHPRLTVNATMDIAVARELLSNLTEQAERLGQYKESVEIWKSLVKRLPTYEINEEGAMREWLDPRFSDNYEHRHLSQIYPFFPGFELCSQSCPELFEAIQCAIEKRGTVGLKDQTGWSLMHMANIKARLGDGAGMMECFSTLAQTCVGKNFFTYHNDYRGMGVTADWFFGRSTPFQIDANMGLTAAVYEMLVQSVPGTIKLLPALPNEIMEGRLSGLRTRAGVTVDLEWRHDPMVLMVSFTSQKDQRIEIHIPEIYTSQTKEELELPAGEVVKRIWSNDHAVAATRC